MFSDNLLKLAKKTITELEEKNISIITIESCTGGLVAGILTAIPGSSAVVHGGFITYANAAKTAMVGVPDEILQAHGAVSEQTARLMASGGLIHSGLIHGDLIHGDLAHSSLAGSGLTSSTTDSKSISIAITGIAGPGGGTKEKPIGLVHFACALSETSKTFHQEMRFGDIGREQIRLASIKTALELVLKTLASQP